MDIKNQCLSFIKKIAILFYYQFFINVSTHFYDSRNNLV